MRVPDLNRLAVFCSVVETGGFRAAAEALGVSKSSVSRDVAALEAELGVTLVERSTRALRVTPTGLNLHRASRQGLDLLERGRQEARSTGSALRGELRVSVALLLGRYLLPELTPAFLRAHPLATLSHHVTDRVSNLIPEGMDAGLRLGAPGGRATSLVTRVLGRMSGRLVAHRSYLERAGEPATLGDLAAHRCLGYGPPGASPSWRLVGPSGPAQTLALQPVLQSNDPAECLQAVREGLGICLLPQIVLATVAPQDEVVVVLRDWRAEPVPLRVVYPAHRSASALLKAYVATIESLCGRWLDLADPS